jgi:hypothetical protein
METKKNMTLAEAFQMGCSIKNNEVATDGLAGITDGQIAFYLEMFGWDATEAHIKRVRKMDNRMPPGNYKKALRLN